MKTLLIGINSRNLHTNLAIRYLNTACKKEGIDLNIFEGNTNQSLSELLSCIYSKEIEVYCFSTYIWNITEVLLLSDSLRKLNPKAVILFGGPEASFRWEEFLEAGAADIVLRGDGEALFPKILKKLGSMEFHHTNIKKEIYACFPELSELQQVSADQLPFPYDLESLTSPIETSQDLLPSKDQILYYEASRGCPYQCSYCLSSALYGVTYRSMEKVFSELQFFMDRKLPLVKFVDRTWNGHRERAKALIQYLLEHPSDTTFHFEAAGDLFDEELLSLMKRLPAGTIQLEIGVQSANLQSLEAACRVTDLEKLKKNVTEILSWGNIHVHLDLIAGLPHEDLASFGRSFDFVFQMKSQMLQLGFLKLLYGSPLREKSAQYDLKANSFPPYEILSTHVLSYEELLLLKDVEETLEQFYNSGRSRTAIDFLLHQTDHRPFHFFMELSKYLRLHGYFQRKQNPKDSAEFLYSFVRDLSLSLTILEDFSSLMHYDWILSRINSPLPEFMKGNEIINITELRKENPALPKELDLLCLNGSVLLFLLQMQPCPVSIPKELVPIKNTDRFLFCYTATRGKKSEPALVSVLKL